MFALHGNFALGNRTRRFQLILGQAGVVYVIMMNSTVVSTPLWLHTACVELWPFSVHQQTWSSSNSLAHPTCFSAWIGNRRAPQQFHGNTFLISGSEEIFNTNHTLINAAPFHGPGRIPKTHFRAQTDAQAPFQGADSMPKREIWE